MEQHLNAFGEIVMAYDSGIGIFKGSMTIKNDRRRNAEDYVENEMYDENLRMIVKATLLEGGAPIGINDVIEIYKNICTPMFWIS